MSEQAIPQFGVLRVVSNSQLDAAEKAAQAADDAAKKAETEDLTQLGSYIKRQFQMMQNHRNSTAGWNTRLISALRSFNGEYDPEKLADIKRFGGSEVYARIIAMKCRGASSLLRDVYLAPDKPWGLSPPNDPDIPAEIQQAIAQLVGLELQSLQQANPQAQLDLTMVRDRTAQLTKAAREAAKKKAVDNAKVAEDKIEEILSEGKFYNALAEFLVDLPVFPFACIKGPVVKIVSTIKWDGQKATVQMTPRMFWRRVSPFDIWFTPGVTDIEDADIIERTQFTRADLNDLLDLPGYNQEAIRAVLEDYGTSGLVDNYDRTDTERAQLESRENPFFNRSGLITCLEFTGNVQGKVLIESGFDPSKIDDPIRDYMVQAWLIGRHLIKVQLYPSPRKRHPYFITSFEKMPGTPVGNALPDILSDIAEVCNASLRSLVNNLSISSGPQVVVNDDRLAPDEDGDELYPWKRWHVTTDPFNASSSQKPVDFFQPQSNAQELLGVYNAFNNIADDLSAIPKYLAGGGAGAAGRTASGLAMLMGNASKILQTVAANIDRDVLDPLLTSLGDMLMLTDQTGIFTGEETFRVMGVQVALQRETLRSRQLEFLQVTANPIDLQIIGPRGRANILRSVADTIGMPGSQIVPSDDDLANQQQTAAQAAQQQGMPGHAGMGDNAGQAQANQAPQDGPANGQTGPRTSIAGGVG